MLKNNLIELTNKLYRMTLLFPKKEPLRYKMRGVADDILADLITWEVFNSSNPGKVAVVEKREKGEVILAIEKDLDVLNGYFEVAKWQNWVSYFDVLEIQEKYDKIKRDFKKEIGSLEIEEKDLKIELLPKPNKANREQFSVRDSESKEPAPERRGSLNRVERQDSLDSRKEKILEFLKEKGRAQVWEIGRIFPEVSKRTLRRDFVQLLEQGLVERIGEKNNTFYRLKAKEI